jgi:small subunit ribosomal protein S6
MVKQYETVFIMTPVLSDEQIKETVEKYQSLLKENNAEIVDENNWGMRKLAYPIQKKSSGYYYLIEFRSEGDLIAKLETTYKRDERLLRFLTVSLNKFAIAYNEKKRNGGLKSQQLAAQEAKNKENKDKKEKTFHKKDEEIVNKEIENKEENPKTEE